MQLALEKGALGGYFKFKFDAPLSSHQQTLKIANGR
jgi:hypothetical protein